MTDVKNISLEGQRAKCGQSGKKRVSPLRVLQLQRLHENNDNDTIIIIIIIIIIIQLLSIIIMIIMMIIIIIIIIIIINTRKLKVTIRRCCWLSGNESLLSLRFYNITKMLTIIFTGSKKTHQCKKQINKQLKHINIL